MSIAPFSPFFSANAAQFLIGRNSVLDASVKSRASSTPCEASYTPFTCNAFTSPSMRSAQTSSSFA
jgi:hypothetical protein